MSKCVKYRTEEGREKHEIIKYYESIEHQGRGSKEETRKKFDLISISSLNTILSQKDEVVRLHETNQYGLRVVVCQNLINSYTMPLLTYVVKK